MMPIAVQSKGATKRCEARPTPGLKYCFKVQGCLKRMLVRRLDCLKKYFYNKTIKEDMQLNKLNTAR
jgi:hypothetical protein